VKVKRPRAGRKAEFSRLTNSDGRSEAQRGQGNVRSKTGSLRRGPPESTEDFAEGTSLRNWEGGEKRQGLLSKRGEEEKMERGQQMD